VTSIASIALTAFHLITPVPISTTWAAVN